LQFDDILVYQVSPPLTHWNNTFQQLGKSKGLTRNTERSNSILLLH